MFKSIYVSYKVLVFCLGFLLLFVAGCKKSSDDGVNPPGFIINSFDINDQNWKVGGDAVSTTPSFTAVGGNPGGYIYTDDKVSGGTWYFIASPGFVSELQKAYGKTLSFDLKQSAKDAQFDDNDLILTSGTVTLTFNTTTNPDITWTNYSVKLDETAGWKKGSANATQADIQSVLQSLNSLQIRGEYRNGADTGGLDNAAIR